MTSSELKRIKEKIISINAERWWGDDFDVRFYLISKLKQRDLKKKLILDVGGGMGIISSELDGSNFRINLDYSLNDLKTCKEKNDSKIHCVCASMTNLPFRKDIFNCVICSHILEIAKSIDIEKDRIENSNRIKLYPTVECVIDEIFSVLSPKGVFFLTTPNNAYYQTTKLDYYELKNSLKNHFKNYSLSFYNTYPRLSKKHKKLNFANIVPKLFSKTVKPEKILNSLVKKDEGKNKESVSFYVEATKN